MTQIRQAILYGARDVRIERRPEPSPGPGEVLIRMETALVCGTDLKVFRRGSHARMLTPPSPFGHEYAGRIVAVGAGVRRFAAGERVTGANSAPCGTCPPCREGSPNLCRDLVFVNGAFGDALLLPARIVERNLLPLPDGVPAAAAAMTEPLACVLHGLDRLGDVPRGPVLVAGIGAIGLLFVNLLSRAGARVLAVGKRPARLAQARAFGAADTACVADRFDPIAWAKRVAPEGIGTAIDCTGDAEVPGLLLEALRPGGTLLLFAGCASDATWTVRPARIHYDEIRIDGVFHHTPDTVRRAYARILSEPDLLLRLLTHEGGLDDLPRLLTALEEDPTAIKAAVRFAEP